MATRLPVFNPSVQRDMERNSRRREHAAAFETATGRISRYVAEEVGLSMRALEEVAHADKRGDAERLEIVIDVARDHKPEADAVAPVRVLARRLGYDLAPTPSAASQGVEVVGVCAAAMAEVGGAIAAALAAVADGRVTAVEARRTLTEIDQAIAQLHKLRGEIAAGAGRRAAGWLERDVE